MSYTSGLNPPQFVNQYWLPVANRIFATVPLPPELTPEIINTLDNIGVPLTIEFVDFEFQDRPIEEVGGKNIIAAVIGHTIVSVLMRYNIQCSAFVEECKYVNHRIDAVMQRYNAITAARQAPVQNTGYNYAINPYVQPQGSAFTSNPVQGYQQQTATPLAQSSLVSSINTVNSQKGADMDLNKHLLQVNQDLYRYNQQDTVAANVAPEPKLEPKFVPPTPEAVTANVEIETDATNNFLKNRIVNNHNRIIVPHDNLLFPTGGKYDTWEYVSLEESLNYLSSGCVVSLETKIDVKYIILPEKNNDNMFFSRLVKLGQCETISELHDAFMMIKDYYSVPSILTWFSNNMSQYITLALKEQYGLEENGFPFISNYLGCSEYLERDNSTGQDISKPIFDLVLKRCSQMFENIQQSHVKVNDVEMDVIEIKIAKPILMFPWALNYRKTDHSLSTTVARQRVSVNHLFDQAFNAVDSSVLYIDVMDISSNEYRVFRGSGSRYSPTNYRVEQRLL